MSHTSSLEYHVPSRSELTRKVPRWAFFLSTGAAVLLVSFVVFLVAIQISDARKQREMLRRCVLHVPIAESAIANDPRFADVTIMAWSKHGSALLIDGYVAQSQDLAALERVIDATNPNVRLDYRVGIGPPPAKVVTMPSSTKR